MKIYHDLFFQNKMETKEVHLKLWPATSVHNKDAIFSRTILHNSVKQKRPIKTAAFHQHE